MAENDSKEHPVFTPHQWANPGLQNTNIRASVMLRFAEKVAAITRGSEVILQIAEQHALDAELHDDGDPPSYFNGNHIGALLRMVQINMDLLGLEAHSVNDWAYNNFTPEGRASSYTQAAQALKSNGERLPRLDD